MIASVLFDGALDLVAPYVVPLFSADAALGGLSLAASIVALLGAVFVFLRGRK